MENKFLVGAGGGKIVILHPPTTPMDRKDAINLAAWLLVIAGATPEEREKAITDVEES